MFKENRPQKHSKKCSQKSFFSSKTENNDENVDEKEFEHDLVDVWKMELDKGLRKRNWMKPEVYSR